jgi:hypothetical protein
VSPRREECRNCGIAFTPHPDDREACFYCQTLSIAATNREIATLMPGDDEPDEPEENGH